MLQLLADAAKSSEDHWTFYLVVIGAITVIQTLCQPIFGWALSRILTRQKDADEKFQKHGNELTLTSSKIADIKEDLTEIKGDVKEAKRIASSVGTEGSGSLAELENRIEREFVRKEAFDKFCANSVADHKETMAILNEIKRGRR